MLQPNDYDTAYIAGTSQTLDLSSKFLTVKQRNYSASHSALLCGQKAAYSLSIGLSSFIIPQVHLPPWSLEEVGGHISRANHRQFCFCSVLFQHFHASGI